MEELTSSPNWRSGEFLRLFRALRRSKRAACLFLAPMLCLATACDSDDDDLESPTQFPPTSTPAQDDDGDGYSVGEGDCDDTDSEVNPGAQEVCDGLIGVDNNCNGLTDEDDPGLFEPPVWYPDADGDGHGQGEAALISCVEPDHSSNLGDDCDDADPQRYPGQLEACDGQDNDCDMETEALGGEVDNDLDGRLACIDCDDDDPSNLPFNLEICDGQDNDCDGLVDDADPDVQGQENYFQDLDGDGHGSGERQSSCNMPSGGVGTADDCSDTDAEVYPGAQESCDGKDNDCDLQTDEGFATTTWYRDLDQDGHGDAAVMLERCFQPSGYVRDDDDCDDRSSSTYPGASEVCDGLDNTCDGERDEGLERVSWYLDEDGDGYGAAENSVLACALPPYHVANSEDCDDSSDTIHPSAVEVCDRIDNNCDGLTDDGQATDARTWYRDQDGDRYGLSSDTVLACATPMGYVSQPGDCDDERSDINPAATENDCDDPTDYNCDGAVGSVDGDFDGARACEDCDDTDANVQTGKLWYVDADEDGFGSSKTLAVSCKAPSGASLKANDCDDSDETIYPGALEVCSDGVDDDCNQVVDDGEACTCLEKSFKGHTYHFCAYPVRWSDARTRCADRGSHLLSVYDQDENDFTWEAATTFGIAYGITEFWIGFTDVIINGDWSWEDFSEVTFTAWDQGQPSNYPDEDCALFRDYEASWRDWYCSEEFGYVCESD